MDADVVFGALRLEMSGKEVVGKPTGTRGSVAVPTHGAAAIQNPFITLQGQPVRIGESVSSAMLFRQRSKGTVTSQASFVTGAMSMAAVDRATALSAGANAVVVLAPPPPHSKVCLTHRVSIPCFDDSTLVCLSAAL